MRERYTGVRSEEVILAMLDKAERKTKHALHKYADG